MYWIILMLTWALCVIETTHFTVQVPDFICKVDTCWLSLATRWPRIHAGCQCIHCNMGTGLDCTCVHCNVNRATAYVVCSVLIKGVTLVLDFNLDSTEYSDLQPLSFHRWLCEDAQKWASCILYSCQPHSCVKSSLSDLPPSMCFALHWAPWLVSSYSCFKKYPLEIIFLLSLQLLLVKSKARQSTVTCFYLCVWLRLEKWQGFIVKPKSATVCILTNESIARLLNCSCRTRILKGWGRPLEEGVVTRIISALRMGWIVLQWGKCKHLRKWI